MDKDFNLGKAVLFRFIRGFISGAVGTMVAIAPFSGQSLHDLGSWLFVLGIIGIAGGVTGGIMALDKYSRS